MVSEIKINLNEYSGSCGDETAEMDLAEEFSPTRERLKKIDEELEKLAKDDANYLAKKSALLMKKSTIQSANNQKRSELHKKQPLVSKLYNLRAASHNGLKEGEKVDSQIQFDNQGNPFLKISKQMDGAVGFDFTITGDGKVVFGAMDDAKMAEVIDFLYRRGITGFELPQGAPRTPEEAQKRVEEGKASTAELDQQTFATQVENIKNKANQEPDPRYIPADEEERTSTVSTNQSAVAGMQEDLVHEQTSAATNTASSASSDEYTFKKSKADLRDWAENGPMKKISGEGLYVSGNTFSFYKDNSRDWHKLDGKVDKKGVREDLVECRIELIKKDGKLSGINYYVGNNGKLDPKYAGEMLTLMKKSGKKYVNFPKGIPADDIPTWRTQCAKKGIIPTGSGVPFGTEDAKIMMDDAGKGLGKTSQEYKDFQDRMGYYLEEKAKGMEKKDPEKAAEMLAYAKELQKEKKFEKLKNVYAPILKKIEVSSKNDGCEAKKIIGSANAATELFKLFDEHGSKSVDTLLNNPDVDLSDGTRKALSRLTGSTNTAIEDLSPEALKIVYQSLEVEMTKEAEITLDENLRSNKNDRSANRLVSNAKKDVQNKIISTMDKKGLVGLTCDINTDKPKHPDPESNNRNSAAMRLNTSTIDR